MCLPCVHKFFIQFFTRSLLSFLLQTTGGDWTSLFTRSSRQLVGFSLLSIRDGIELEIATLSLIVSWWLLKYTDFQTDPESRWGKKNSITTTPGTQLNERNYIDGGEGWFNNIFFSFKASDKMRLTFITVPLKQKPQLPFHVSTHVTTRVSEIEVLQLIVEKVGKRVYHVRYRE